jgi:hypothetical protein
MARDHAHMQRTGRPSLLFYLSLNSHITSWNLCPWPQLVSLESLRPRRQFGMGVGAHANWSTSSQANPLMAGSHATTAR